MAEPKMEKKAMDEQNTGQDENLKGTFVSVLILGGFLVVSWVGVWALYLIR